MLHIDRNERLFIGATLLLIVVFALALFVGGVAGGIDVPAPYLRVDPRTVETDPSTPFSLPPQERIIQTAPGKYDVYIIAQLWKFVPGTDFEPSRALATSSGGNYQIDPIRVPKGSTVTFNVTSKDIQHGMKIIGTNISFMILPGQVSRLTATFDQPGTYTMVCYEYCGSAHHLMYGEILVTE